jgi:hypothetical protein
MKQYFKIFLLLFFLGSLTIIAKYSYTSKLFSGVGDEQYVSTSHSISTMDGSVPDKDHVLILFRKGIDEKGILIFYPFNQELSLSHERSVDISFANAGHIKYVLLFSYLLALPPEFLASSSFRSPPILC